MKEKCVINFKNVIIIVYIQNIFVVLMDKFKTKKKW